MICVFFFLFFFNDPATTDIYTLSLHDALPIPISICPVSIKMYCRRGAVCQSLQWSAGKQRSEEHTSELQSRFDLVCRLLLEKKNKYMTRVFYALAHSTDI